MMKDNIGRYIKIDIKRKFNRNLAKFISFFNEDTVVIEGTDFYLSYKKIINEIEIQLDTEWKTIEELKNKIKPALNFKDVKIKVIINPLEEKTSVEILNGEIIKILV